MLSLLARTHTSDCSEEPTLFLFQLEEWWLHVAYLDVRTPSQLNVNFVGPSPHFEHYWPAKEGTQLERGSIILWHNLNYWQLLRR